MATINGNDNANTLDGTIFGDTIDGKGGDDILDGKGSGDRIIGGTGKDNIHGGTGDDTFAVGFGHTAVGELYNGESGTDTIEINAGLGTPATFLNADFSKSSILSIEKLVFKGDAQKFAIFSGVSVNSSGLSTTLQVTGSDTGPSTVRIDMLSDTSIDLSGWTFVNWSQGRVQILGDANNETMIGTSQRDTLGGGGGVDNMSAGGGDDFIGFQFNLAGTVADGGTGFDTIIETNSNADYSGFTFKSIEALRFVQPTVGNNGVQKITLESGQFGGGGLSTSLNIENGGNIGHKTIEIGLDDGDTSFSAGSFTFDVQNGLDFLVSIIGNNVAETITGSTVDDLLQGLGGNDLLVGGVGDDALLGGTGADTMLGGAGDDTYTVDDIDDRVAEIIIGDDPGGDDEVQSTISFELGALIENLVLKGTGAIDGTGNELDNFVGGNSASNTLKGLAGNDTLQGSFGADTLIGGQGADTYFFNQLADSLPGGGNRDVIKGFDHGTDVVDLSIIDFDEVTDGVQSLAFDTDGSFSVGEVRLRVANGDTFIEVNADDDARAEMQILVQNVTNLTVDDLIFA